MKTKFEKIVIIKSLVIFSELTLRENAAFGEVCLNVIQDNGTNNNSPIKIQWGGIPECKNDDVENEIKIVFEFFHVYIVS